MSAVAVLVEGPGRRPGRSPGPPAAGLTVSVLSGPKPMPATLMAMVAIPWAAMEAATNGAAHSFLLPLVPWP